MSPLWFGPNLDGVACSTSSQEEDEVACATRCTAERCAFDTGVDVGGQRYRMLLYADTVVCIHNRYHIQVVLFSRSARELIALSSFCAGSYMRVNTQLYKVLMFNGGPISRAAVSMGLTTVWTLTKGFQRFALWTAFSILGPDPIMFFGSDSRCFGAGV
jgi:hypothetical protein